MRARPDGRVILLGANGTIGRLTAGAMVRQGLQPLLAGRNEIELRDLAEELSDRTADGAALDVAVVSTDSPDQLRALVQSSGDVLVSCIGPASRRADTVVSAAAEAGCGYLDCVWEPPFVRKVFSQYGPLAASNGAVLLPAFGCHDVAGSLAATIAVRRTMTGSRPPARVDIGYFVLGAGRGVPPSVALIEDSYRWTGGRLRPERPGVRVRSFEVGAGKQSEGLSLGSAEHFTVPRLAATIADVNVYVGWYGRLTKAAAVAGAVSGPASRVPGFGSVWESMVRGVSGSSGPGSGSDNATGRSRSLVVAETYDADGVFQQRVRVEGPPPQELTGSLLSWGAGMLLRGAEDGVGALGPAEAFGTEAVVSGCMALGLAEIHHRH